MQGAEEAPPSSARVVGWRSVGVDPDSRSRSRRGPFSKLAERLPPRSPACGFARPPWRSPLERAIPAPMPSAFHLLQVLDVQQRDEGLSGGKLNSKWLLEPLGFYS